MFYKTNLSQNDDFAFIHYCTMGSHLHRQRCGQLSIHNFVNRDFKTFGNLSYPRYCIRDQRISHTPYTYVQI